MEIEQDSYSGLEIAIIGMAGRFPGSQDIHRFWENLCNANEGISEIDPESIQALGISKEQIDDPTYICAGGVLEHDDCFDASFFGYSPREATVLDPQQRVFLECAWHAMEDSGYAPGDDPRAVGVFAGAGMNGHLLRLYANQELREQVSPYEIFVGNDKDFLSTRVSYKLNLRGPSVAVQTACSSSLVAVHMACQSLLAGECDFALAGGVAIAQQKGYQVQTGGIYSEDGHCRAFDKEASGTVSGNGVGIVVLKRLQDALDDGDRVDAVIKGSAVNNDGAMKVSYTAPQVDQQARVIRDALAVAQINAASISYIEAHGTGTPMGDPIEMTALTEAYRADTENCGYCAIGSVKTNIGHLDAAAGIAGLIKTVLALKHSTLPASLHFKNANPQIDFANSPFTVNAKTREWPAEETPRRAGVSSFGIGGTNAHIVLEQAPKIDLVEAEVNHQLLTFSAHNEQALEKLSSQYSDYLKHENTNNNLIDIAFTLQTGRRDLAWRRAFVSNDKHVASENIQHAPAIQSSQSKNTIVFLYPGQASQYPGMATALYSNQPVFRTALDTCAEILGSKINIRKLLLEDASEETVTKTENAQPCLFTFEYALTQLWLSWGIKPSAMLGHSLGEWVAACIADVMSLESAINIVAERGRLMQAMPAGAMLAVPLTAEAINQELDQDLVIAAYNAPSLCAISGSLTAIETLETKLNSKGISAKRLHTSHAFHSPSMQDAVAPLIEIVSKQTLSAPTIPFISNVSGTWITDAQATDANYWGNQLRVAVRFDKGLDTIAKLDNPLLIELGPGKTLGTLARMTIADENPIRCIQTQADIHQKDQTDANQMALTALGQAWCEGVNVDWSSMARTSHQDYQPKRVQLPVYPFARDRYSVETNLSALQTQPSKSLAHTDMKSWFSMPSWQRQSPLSLAPAASDRVHWLLFADSHGIADKLAEKIEHAGQDAYRVHAGENFSQSAYRCFNIKRDAHESYQELFADLANRDATPGQIVWLWPLDMEKSNGHTNTARIAFLELLTLIKVISEFAEPIQLTVITKHGQDVSGFETLHTNQNAITGLVQVVGQEYPHIGCRLVDLENELTKSTADELLQELFVVEPPIMSAWRSGTRWVQNYTPLALPDLNSLAHKPIRNLKREGHYVIIGDIDNGLGRFWAQSLKTHYEAKLTLIDTSDNTDNKYTNALYINTPASDETQLQAALTQSVEEFGRISGIFYSSPTTNSNSAAPLALMHEHHWKYTQENKLSALLTLANSLAEHQPDFVCVQSSLSSIIGGIGLAAYAAANHQLEVITCQQNKSSHVPWFAINWDACDESQNNETNANTLGAALAEFALNPDEVWQATERILCLAPTGQIIVSRAPLEARIEQWLSSRPRDHHADTVGARPKGKHDSHERPDLNTEYVAPGDEIEITVAKIWQTSLGIDQVGVNDNFFELGGHSLLAIQVIGKLRDAFPVEIEIQQLLSDNPTVANVAAALKQRLPEADDLNTMAELLQEIKAAEDMEQTAGGKG